MKIYAPILALTLMFSMTSVSRGADPVTVAGLDFKPTAEWTFQKPASSMRAAEFTIMPTEDGDALTAVFYYFGPGQGGSAQANIDRWLGQFEGKPQKQESKEHQFGETSVTVLEASGTYMESQGGPFGPKTAREGYSLLGAVVPGSDAAVFVKLTGPSDNVAAIKDKFVALVTSPFEKAKTE